MEITIFKNHVAKAIGIEKAIMLCRLEYWIEKNKANNVHFHDGKWWTYNSAKAWEQLLGGIMNEHKIYRILKSLCDDGLIQTGNFNKTSMDRTMWYAITDKGYALLSNDAAFEEEKLSKRADAQSKADTAEKAASTAENSRKKDEKADYMAKSPGFQNEQMQSPNLKNANDKNENSVCQNSKMDLTNLIYPFDEYGGAIPEYTQYKHNMNTKENMPQRRQRFQEPSTLEVENFCKEKGFSHVNAAVFVNFYAGKNWMVGKNKMTDWRSIVASWEERAKEKESEKNDQSYSKSPPKETSKPSYDLSKYANIGLNLKPKAQN